MEKKLKLLLSDNSESFEKTCGNALRKRNVDVITCEKNGVMILEAIKQNKPDVVLVDMVMIGFDALAVMDMIRRDRMAKQPMFMVMSNIDNEVIEKQVLNAGAAYYFIKPINSHMLVERILQLYDWSLSLNTEEYGKDYYRATNMDDRLDFLITGTLHQLGMPSNVKGFEYIREAIKLSVEDSNILNNITKVLYPTIAEHYHTTASGVERTIRHAIDLSWQRGDLATLESYFGHRVYQENGKPTNSQFIALLSHKLRMHTAYVM